MFKITPIPILILILLISPVHKAYSYYYANENHICHFEIEKSDLSINGNYFTVFDNQEEDFKKYNHSILTAQSDYFIPLDVIDLNFPLNFRYNFPVNTENLLARSIYANLRIIKYLNEYNDLRNRTRENLSNLSVPYLDNRVIEFLPGNDSHSISTESIRLQLDYQILSSNLNTLFTQFHDNNTELFAITMSDIPPMTFNLAFNFSSSTYNNVPNSLIEENRSIPTIGTSRHSNSNVYSQERTRPNYKSFNTDQSQFIRITNKIFKFIIFIFSNIYALIFIMVVIAILSSLKTKKRKR